MFVLDAIADDYENLEKIDTHVNRLALECGLTIHSSEVLQALIDLIATGLAKAYRLSTVVPAEEFQGVPTAAEVKDYYFWVTEKGREV